GEAEGHGPLRALGKAVCGGPDLGSGFFVWWFLFVGWDALKNRSGVFGIPVPGGCGHRKVFWCCLVCPPGVFFDLVTGSTQPGRILPAGWSTIAIRGGMINILDPTITVRGPTRIISEHHHPA